MRSSTRATLAIAMLAVGAFALAGCGGMTKAAPTAHATPANGSTVTLPISSAADSVRLTTQFGDHESLADLRGQTLVVTPFLTQCQEVCPMTTANVRAAATAIDKTAIAEHVTFIEVTVDPKRDDVKHLAAYQNLYGQQPSIMFMTGTLAQITTFWNGLHLAFANTASPQKGAHDWLTGAPLTYDVQHQNVVYVIGADGKVHWLVDGMPNASALKLPTTLYHFLTKDGIANYTKPAVPDWSASDIVAAVKYVNATVK